MLTGQGCPFLIPSRERIGLGARTPVFLGEQTTMSDSFCLSLDAFERKYRAILNKVEERSKWYSNNGRTARDIIEKHISQAAVKASTFSGLLDAEEVGLTPESVPPGMVDNHLGEVSAMLADLTRTAVSAFTEARRLDQMLSANFNQRLYSFLSVW